MGNEAMKNQESSVQVSGLLNDLVQRGLLWSPQVHSDLGSTEKGSLEDQLAEFFALGAVHEIAGDFDWSFSKHDYSIPPLFMVAAFLRWSFARRWIRESSDKFGKIIWIGKECWPSPHFLLTLQSSDEGDRSNENKLGSEILKNSIFVDPSSPKKTLWCLNRAISSNSVNLVIASVANYSFAFSRRLTLNADKFGTRALILVKPQFLNFKSCAATRWLVTLNSSESLEPSFKLVLKHSKGKRAIKNDWNIEPSYDKSFSINIFP